MRTSYASGPYDVPSVVAFDATTGRQLWRWRDSALRIDDLAVGPKGHQVFLAGSHGWDNGSRLVALAAGTGSVVWHATRRGRGWRSMTVSGDGHSVFVGGFGPRTETHRESRTVVASYAAGTGAIRWHTRVGSQYVSTYPESLTSTSDARTVVLGFAAQESKAQQCPAAAAATLRAVDGRVRWITVLAEMPGCGGVQQVRTAAGLVLLPWSEDRGGRGLPETHVAGLLLDSGRRLWTRLDMEATVGPVSPAGRFFISAQTTADALPPRLLALGLRTGRTIWNRSVAVEGSPAITPDGRRVYVAGAVTLADGSRAGVLIVRSALDGDAIWHSAPYRGPLAEPAGMGVASSSWDLVVSGHGGNRVLVAGENYTGYPGEESSRTIPLFAAYAA